MSKIFINENNPNVVSVSDRANQYGENGFKEERSGKGQKKTIFRQCFYRYKTRESRSSYSTFRS